MKPGYPRSFVLRLIKLLYLITVLSNGLILQFFSLLLHAVMVVTALLVSLTCSKIQRIPICLNSLLHMKTHKNLFM